MHYRKLNTSIKKDHFPLPFMDQMLDWLAGRGRYCFLDGYSDITNYPLPRRIKKRLLSLVLMGSLHSRGFYLVVVMC